MKKNGYSLVNILIVIVVLLILTAVVITQFIRSPREWKRIDSGLKTDVDVTLVRAIPEFNKKATLLYSIENRWNYSLVQFKDFGLDGNLDEVYGKVGALHESIFDPNSEYPSSLGQKGWDIWLQRFEEVRKEAVIGLKPGAEEYLSKRK